MIYLTVCLLCILGVELFIRLPFRRYIVALWHVSKKSVRVVTSSGISDHWKEKALQRYSRDMALASLRIGFLLVVMGLLIGIAAYLCDLLLPSGGSILEFISSGSGISVAIIVSCVYVFVRNKLGAP